MEIHAKSADRNLLLEFSGELDHHGARNALRELEMAVDAALPSVFTNICGLMLAPSTLGAEDMAIHPVGTGAFKLEEYVEGDHIFLTAYENYRDKGADGQALPYLDRVESTSWAMTPCARSTCRPAISTWWTM